MYGASGSIGSSVLLLLQFCVLHMPWWCIWPFAVAGLGFKYFEMPFAVRLGHPLRYPLLMAFRSDEMQGLHNYWWANWILFALFLIVCVKNAICVVA